MGIRRIFAAIEITDGVRQAVSEHITELRVEDRERAVRWERPDKMHITLKFLAEADEAALSSMDQALAAAAGSTAPFTAEISGTGVFPDRRNPRVLWFGVGEGEATIKAIAADIETRCVHQGLPPEIRQFHPHLTAGRIRDARRARAVTQRFLEAGFAAKPFLIERLVLMESRLLPGGSEYSVLSAYQLGA
jgi:2'-5' RNA ligase